MSNQNAKNLAIAFLTPTPVTNNRHHQPNATIDVRFILNGHPLPHAQTRSIQADLANSHRPVKRPPHFQEPHTQTLRKSTSPAPHRKRRKSLPANNHRFIDKDDRKKLTEIQRFFAFGHLIV